MLELESTTEFTSVLGQSFWDTFAPIMDGFSDMAAWLLENKLFLIGIVIFVIGACIGLVKRVIS